MKIVITKKRISAKKIVVFINPWLAPQGYYKSMISSIPENFGYIDAYYDKELLTDNPILTRKNFWKFLNRLNENIPKNRDLYMYSQSLGGCFAMMLADEILFKKIIIIAPGDNLAQSFWDGDLTQDLKKAMQSRKITLSNLRKTWEKISPDYYFKKYGLRSKYAIKLATKDTSIPIERGNALIKLMNSKHVRYSVEFLDKKHGEICALEIQNPKKSIRWLVR